MDVTKPSEIAELLKQHGIKVRKSWGQNFLINPAAVEGILTAAALTGKETVLEVGPGLGVMTGQLLARASQVFAIEIDPLLCRHLRQRFTQPNFHLVEGDALAQDLQSLVPRPYLVVANLPYYITSPFLIKLLEEAPPQAAVILVQLEVAKRLTAAPGTSDYGSLSVLVQYHCQGEIIMKLGPGNFFPPPQVDSAVVRLTWRPPPRTPRDEGLMFRIVRTAFSQRRKMLKGLLAHSLNIEADAVAAALAKMGLDAQIRGERLSVEDFITLSDLVGELL